MSGASADARANEDVACPWCESVDVERLSAFGPMHMTEQWFCRACRTPFERVRQRDRPGEVGR